MFMDLFKSLIIIVPVLISMAFLTLLESKVLGYTQMSKGPNMVGIMGLFQPMADGVKLFLKETSVPSNVSFLMFLFAPIFSLILSFLVWSLIPLNYSSILIEIPQSLIFVLGISSVGIYCILMSGWGSNSSYAFLGSLSASAQMISYEISMGLILMIMIILSNSLNLIKIFQVQEICIVFIMSLFPMAFLFLISSVAEMNSAPFDLTEGESELVSGFNIEYPGMIFALFFLAEYGHMMFNGFLFSLLFLGGWKGFFLSEFMFFMKSCLMMFFYLWVSTSFPSISYDQLMHLMWKSYLPLSMGFMMIFPCILFFFDFI